MNQEIDFPRENCASEKILSFRHEEDPAAARRAVEQIRPLLADDEDRRLVADTEAGLNTWIVTTP